MERKAVSGIMMILLLFSMLTLLFNVQPAKASGTIYIEADGSVNPPSAPISSVDNVTYIFTGNINEPIVVERDNIVVDGAGYTVQGTGSGTGIDLSYRSNVTLKNVEVTNFGYGIWLYRSSNNTLASNNASNNGNGIDLSYSSDNIVTANTVSNNQHGIDLGSSSNNTLVGNTASSNNPYGIHLYSSSNNVLFHNNLINNTFQADVTTGYVNTWDNGYPSGGNYWSDYTGVDFYSGPYQNITGSDGIGDTSYTVSGPDQDDYPLMNPMGSPQPPIAIFTYIPEHPVVNETATFNATSSYDRDGSIVSYKWDFGDGNVTTVIGPVITHVYAASGNYTLNLTVTDNDGLNHSTTKTIIADSTHPTTLHGYDGLWHTTDFTINLTATDDISGVAETYYKMNDGPTKTVSIDGQPRITTEGANNTLEYWSVDKADNEELPHKILTEIKLDKTASTIGIPSRIPDGDVLPGQAVKISVNVTDTLSQVKNVTLFYTINNGTTWENLPMNYNASTSLYKATIPGQLAGTWVKYKIVAYDNAENPATKDGTEPYSVYQVIPEFPSAIILSLFMVLTILALAFSKRRFPRKTDT